jgi:hypothetical protein
MAMSIRNFKYLKKWGVDALLVGAGAVSRGSGTFSGAGAVSRGSGALLVGAGAVSRGAGALLAGAGTFLRGADMFVLTRLCQAVCP